MHPFGMTIPATVLQGSEIPEGLMNNPLYIYGVIQNDCRDVATSFSRCNPMYRISWPIRRTFFSKKCDLNSTCVHAPRVSIISKLINTRTAIIQHLYHEIVKFASKS
jgi:hypothetical protein